MNIELPKDAEGREIPLDTEVLYDKDGHPNDVSYFTYAPRSYASAMHLTPPDSWEKLEEDLDMCVAENTACMYFSKDGTCLDVVFAHHDKLHYFPGFISARSVVELFADLIDPPTTTYICEKCGGEWPSDIMFECCPYCGTVIDDDEH